MLKNAGLGLRFEGLAVRV